MSDEKRKCIVTDCDVTTKGYFIQYGNKIVYDESNNLLQETIAIVEAKDGTVLTVSPSQVKFINE